VAHVLTLIIWRLHEIYSIAKTVFEHVNHILVRGGGLMVNVIAYHQTAISHVLVMSAMMKKFTYYRSKLKMVNVFGRWLESKLDFSEIQT